jgi:hypothetical protein
LRVNRNQTSPHVGTLASNLHIIPRDTGSAATRALTEGSQSSPRSANETVRVPATMK